MCTRSLELLERLVVAVEAIAAGVESRSAKPGESRASRQQRAVGYLADHPDASLFDVSAATHIAVRTLQTYPKLMTIIRRRKAGPPRPRMTYDDRDVE